VKRTHPLLDQAHQAMVSNGGHRPRETVKKTHVLSNQPIVNHALSRPYLVELAIEGDL
jgi:hypothetical protein